MTQQGETPNGGQPFSMADMVGFMMRDLFSHGINMEEHLMQARQGAQNLGLQLQMAHRAMDEGEKRIGELTDRVNALEVLLEQGFALVGKAFSHGSQPVSMDWMRRAEGWADQVNEARTTRINLTDEMPLPAPRKDDSGLHAHDCVERDCTGCFDAGA